MIGRSILYTFVGMLLVAGTLLAMSGVDWILEQVVGLEPNRGNSDLVIVIGMTYGAGMVNSWRVSKLEGDALTELIDSHIEKLTGAA